MARPCFLCHTRLTTWATTRHLGTTPACGLRRPPNPSDTQAGPTAEGDPEGHPSPEARPLTGQDPSAPTRPSCLSSAGHRTARHRLCRPDPTAAGSPQARAPRRAQILKGNTEGRPPEEQAAAVKRGPRSQEDSFTQTGRHRETKRGPESAASSTRCARHLWEQHLGAGPRRRGEGALATRDAAFRWGRPPAGARVARGRGKGPDASHGPLPGSREDPAAADARGG